MWSRGASVNAGALKGALIGSVSADGAQGVLLGVQHLKDFDKLQQDPSIPPHQRVQRLLEIFRSAAIDGALIYVSVRGTRADLERMDVISRVDGKTSRQRLAELGDPNATVALTKPPVIEAEVAAPPHTTRVDLDQEMQPAQVSGRPHVLRTRSATEAFKDALGHKRHAELLAEVKPLRAQHPELATLTDNELVALRGYTTDLKRPEFGGLTDHERMNNALRFSDAPQLATLQPYIDMVRSGLAKLPKFQGTVYRMLNRVEPDDIRKQFVKGRNWTNKAFMSTSTGRALDHGQVQFVFKSTQNGAPINNLSPFNEREILFPPGGTFKTLDVLEYIPGRFLISLKAIN